MTPEERGNYVSHDQSTAWNPWVPALGQCNLDKDALSALIAAAIREAVEDEREACAKVTEAENSWTGVIAGMYARMTIKNIAKAIRGRCSREQRPPAD